MFCVSAPNTITSACSKGIVAAILPALFGLLPEVAFAASFPCEKTTTPIEKTICADPELSILDERLAATYQRVLAAAADKEAIRSHQRKWITSKRNMCPDRACLKAEYETRFAQLSRFKSEETATSSAPTNNFQIVAGSYKCNLNVGSTESETSENLQLAFEVGNSEIINFSSFWVVSSKSPDVRPGYAATCQVRMDKLRQIQRADYMLLKYQAAEHEKDHEGCEIRIWGDKTSVRVRSSGCTYPCLMLNLVIDKDSGTCRNVEAH